jgi:hypothetical protein
MALADIEVVEIVSRRDLDRAGSLFVIGMRRPTSGRIAVLPIRSRRRSFSGCTATAVSPSIVSGRVVATTMASSDPSIG